LTRVGFGLIELIVALTILAFGVLGMAAAAVYAHQSFMRAETSERVLRMAGTIMDSLTASPTPASGELVGNGIVLRWTVERDSAVTGIALTVDYIEAGRLRHEAFHAIHDAAPAR
jgi:Tfp pilus assembly protein PilV